MGTAWPHSRPGLPSQLHPLVVPPNTKLFQVARIAVGWRILTHDELDGPDEVTEKLENEVLLLFLHLVQAISV